ncbi:MAG: hypothetical protein EXR87_04690 [Gammaproteobacteria bacterium]|nr:hypothetical protein [Gammaproteobacteria bacterium]
MTQLVMLVLTALLAAGCASGPRRNMDEESVSYLDYAGEPIRGFTSFRLQSWRPLSRNRLVLWAGVNEAYLVTIWDGCPDLQFANAIKVNATGNQITTFDRVEVGRDRCPISEIRPINIRQMKADRAADKEPRKQP